MSRKCIGPGADGMYWVRFKTYRKEHVRISRFDALVCYEFAKAGQKQRELAEGFDISQSTVSRIVTRKHRHTSKK